MAKKKEDRRVKFTKMFLKESLIELLEKKNISKITIKEICENADINRATFYAHYADQYDLLKSIEDEYINKVLEGIKYTDRGHENIYPLVVDILTFMHDNARVSKLLLSDRGDINFPKKVMEIVYVNLLQNITEELQTNMRKNQIISAYVISGCVGTIENWFEHGLQKTPEELADIITSLALNSLKQIE